MAAHARRLERLQADMAAAGFAGFVVADPDSVAYFTGYAGYLGMEFGRATLLVVPADGRPVLVTPAMEAEMAEAMTAAAEVHPWRDGDGGEWMDTLAPLLLQGAGTVAIEAAKTPPRVAAAVMRLAGGERVADGTALVDGMRMVKDAEEIETMRQAGRIAAAMMAAAREALGEGVPEYELWLAASAAGSRAAAGLLGDEAAARLVSPLVQGVPPVQSGTDTSMVHRRASTRRLRRGEPVYLCFCGLAAFRHVKLGFDRQFFVGEAEAETARMLEAALAAQAAALAAIRPGVPAEQVHFAAGRAYREAGFAPAYRTGRGIGLSLIEPPELKPGDRTPLVAGMAFSVDGGVTVAGTGGGRVGDSVVVTDDGCELLTDFPKGVTVV